jgi:hypothetical protein
MSPIGTLLPIQHVRCEVGSLSETGPLVLDTRLSHLDPTRTSQAVSDCFSACRSCERPNLYSRDLESPPSQGAVIGRKCIGAGSEKVEH